MEAKKETWLDHNWGKVALALMVVLIVEIIIYCNMGVAYAH